MVTKTQLFSLQKNFVKGCLISGLECMCSYSVQDTSLPSNNNCPINTKGRPKQTNKTTTESQVHRDPPNSLSISMYYIEFMKLVNVVLCQSLLTRRSYHNDPIHHYHEQLTRAQQSTAVLDKYHPTYYNNSNRTCSTYTGSVTDVSYWAQLLGPRSSRMRI